MSGCHLPLPSPPWDALLPRVILSSRQAVGLEPDDRGLLRVDDTYQTPERGIYACGDVIGYPALASTSMEQGIRAAHHMWSERPEVRIAPVTRHPRLVSPKGMFGGGGVGGG